MNWLTDADVLRKIHNLPSLPVVVLALLASLGQDEVNIDLLADQLAQDQALTAKTLRLANSSFYGMAKPVTSIHECITILGFRTVRSLATTTALIGAFAGHSPRHFNATPFWRHALATAVTARVLASQLKLNPDEAYTAGLLHDIGRLVLVTQFPAPYERVMAFRSAHDVALLAAEQAVLGLNHATVGLLLTQNWKFPPAMQQAVAHHHATELAGLPVLTLLVIAANVLAHALDLSQDPEALVPAVPTGLWAQLGLDEAALLAVLQQTEAQFEAAHVVLNT